MIEREISISRKGNHYEAYVDGKFICSGDTFKECEEELNQYLNELYK